MNTPEEISGRGWREAGKKRPDAMCRLRAANLPPLTGEDIAAD